MGFGASFFHHRVDYCSFEIKSASMLFFRVLVCLSGRDMVVDAK